MTRLLLAVLAFATFIGLAVYVERQRRRAVAAQALADRTGERVMFAQAAAHIGSWEIGADGRALWSESVRELMGLPTDAPASADTFRALVHPEDFDAVAAAQARMLAVPGEHEFEYRVRRPDGEVRWMLSRGRHLVDPDGRRPRVLGVVMDITERQAEKARRAQLEQLLTQAQKLETIGQLAGGIAHDFNNVLTGIGGFAELARTSISAGRAPSGELDEIMVGVERAASLTRQLLAFGRKQVLREEVIDLNDVVRETEGLLRRVIGEDIVLEHTGGDADVRVQADRTQIEQVIMNLVVNARDSMPHGGRVTIEVGEVEVCAEHTLDLVPGRFALVAVSDTGQGMDAETAARIFEPFFTTKSQGTGLGLATVHGIVNQSGGTIWVYSEPGSGTTFKVYLPLAEGLPAAAACGAPEASAGGAGERILLVEDDRQVRAIVTRMLTQRGFDVTTAAGGEEAMARSKASARFDLILSDLVMPDVSGMELAETLRVEQPSAAVLFMSGYSDTVVRRDGVMDPGSAFIEKPFSSDELIRRIRSLLDAKVLAAA